ncbi:autotransporter assembly complex family protein [Stappia sp. ES.058]|uniref:autotransporter assembly complex protein TamA n=1 Tax=Stappia sp. ES.058 TaxID=1881061 RepID=UPI000879B87F|nr:autotransporter assembly complex family protein [Stappia sp. ES.058]SDU02210.1 autotransporter secretion outer membrane protein TamA [Stappia sp. ES.058]
MHCVSVLALAASLLVFPARADALDLFGWLPFGSKTADEQDQPPVVDPLPYEASLRVSGGSADLEAALAASSELLSQGDRLPSGEAGLIARAVSDFERLVGRLYVGGYYAGTVKIRIAGLDLEQALATPSLPGPRPIPVIISVEPGPLFSFGTIDISAADDSSGVVEQVANGATYGLVRGETANSEKILRAEKAIVSDLKAAGHPFARISRREIVADHDTNRLDVRLSVAAGRAARFGKVSVSGAEATDPDFIVTQAMIPQGRAYSPAELERATGRLNELGIFSSVRIVPAENVGPDGLLPMTIEVSERKRNVIGVGANWSSSEGFGVESYWRRRNLFGRGELLSIEGSIGRIADNSLSDLEYSARIAFEKPGAFGPQTRFTTSLGAKQEVPDAYRSRSITADAFYERDVNDVLSFKVGGEVQYADENDAFGNQTYLLTGVIGQVNYDTRDDPLNPTKGINAVVFAEPAYDVRGGNAMLFTRGQVSAYQALDDAARFVLAGRLGAGSIIAPSVRDIPAARRFFSGGGGSIRGYAYRNVGPRRNGEVTGGRSFFEASGEIRMKATETIGVVGFVDAGNSFDAMYPDFSQGLKVGVGAGLRYFTPVGPLRFDIAVPLDPEKDDPDFAVYVGLSQAF